MLRRFYYEENKTYNIEIRLFIFSNLAKHEKAFFFIINTNIFTIYNFILYTLLKKSMYKIQTFSLLHYFYYFIDG